MSPYEHGEVFVLEDGGEADLDLGNYERFLDLTLGAKHSITLGRMMYELLQDERKGAYIGRTIQITPHLTDKIKDEIKKAAEIKVRKDGKAPEICLIEIGGTVGDMESSSFLEAVRQISLTSDKNDVCLILVSYVPLVNDELKTKPTQHAAKELRTAGLIPNVIVARSGKQLSKEAAAKIALYTNVQPSMVFSAPDCTHILQEPLIFEQQELPKRILEHLGLRYSPPDMSQIVEYVDRHTKIMKQDKEYNIAIVGKYVRNTDTYCSVVKALEHAAVAINVKLKLHWIESFYLSRKRNAIDPVVSDEKYDFAWQTVKSADGIIVPGGFGFRGTEGKLLAIKYARENKIPYLGLCYGMQLAVIESFKHIIAKDLPEFTDCGTQENEEEHIKCYNKKLSHQICIHMPEIDKNVLGGNMRRGSYRCNITSKDTLSYKLYGKMSINERHRHRYEINPKYHPYLERYTKLKMTGFADMDTNNLLEVVEQEDHPFFWACQFHPELQSKYLCPSPPFVGFALAVCGRLETTLMNHGGTLQIENFFNKAERERFMQLENSLLKVEELMKNPILIAALRQFVVENTQLLGIKIAEESKSNEQNTNSPPPPEIKESAPRGANESSPPKENASAPLENIESAAREDNKSTSDGNDELIPNENNESTLTENNVSIPNENHESTLTENNVSIPNETTESLKDAHTADVSDGVNEDAESKATLASHETAPEQSKSGENGEPQVLTE
eukprot:TRINITY_DN444_c0_g1_i1.p1 TRINITY_DN444_c0_g1~~TRINITY_DN444_c0_g1_i1.p1  ORF type:complete len:731 (+),score=147.60 TRINITY_DN444_c0_g1_i1:360-2552(+)